jgi:hypothetical protein
MQRQPVSSESNASSSDAPTQGVFHQSSVVQHLQRLPWQRCVFHDMIAVPGLQLPARSKKVKDDELAHKRWSGADASSCWVLSNL